MSPVQAVLASGLAPVVIILAGLVAYMLYTWLIRPRRERAKLVRDWSDVYLAGADVSAADMLFLKDQATGLPLLPEGLYWVVETPTTVSGLKIVLRQNVGDRYVKELGYYILSPANLGETEKDEDEAILKAARVVVERAVEDYLDEQIKNRREARLLGTYPPKSLS